MRFQVGMNVGHFHLIHSSEEIHHALAISL